MTDSVENIIFILLFTSNRVRTLKMLELEKGHEKMATQLWH